MTIWISLELPLFNFERHDMWFARIGQPCEKLWSFEFLDSFRYFISSVSIYYKPESDLSVKSYDHLNFSRTSVVDFRVSLYVSHLNRTSVVQFQEYRYVMRLNWRSVKSYDHLNYSRASVIQFRACRHIMPPNRTSEWIVITTWISRELPMFNFERLDIL